jgi:hypothetical protein
MTWQAKNQQSQWQDKASRQSKTPLHTAHSLCSMEQRMLHAHVHLVVKKQSVEWFDTRAILTTVQLPALSQVK